MKQITLVAVSTALRKQYDKIERELQYLGDEGGAHNSGKRSGLIAAQTALWKAMNEIRVEAGLEPTKFFNTNRATA